MLQNILTNMLNKLGETKFTIVYAILFTVFVNGIALTVMKGMDKPLYSVNQTLLYLAGYAAVGAFIARQIIRKQGGRKQSGKKQSGKKK